MVVALVFEFGLRDLRGRVIQFCNATKETPYKNGQARAMAVVVHGDSIRLPIGTFKARRLEIRKNKRHTNVEHWKVFQKLRQIAASGTEHVPVFLTRSVQDPKLAKGEQNFVRA